MNCSWKNEKALQKFEELLASNNQGKNRPRNILIKQVFYFIPYSL